MPPEGPDTWPKADSRSQWLVFYRLDNMTLTGKGTIEGNGEQWWNLPCKPHRVNLKSPPHKALFQNNIYLISFFI